MIDRLIILDLEYTAWQGSLERRWSGLGEHREVVQISCLSFSSLKYIHDIHIFSRLVKPKINPVLSHYFTDLTGITQDTIDSHGLEYTTAYEDLKRIMSNGIYCSWGEDVEVLNENHRLYKMSVLPSDELNSFDIRSVFSSFDIDITNFTSGTIYNAFGDSGFELLPGKVHNATSDVWSIYLGLRKLIEKHGYKQVQSVIEECCCQAVLPPSADIIEPLI